MKRFTQWAGLPVASVKYNRLAAAVGSHTGCERPSNQRLQDSVHPAGVMLELLHWCADCLTMHDACREYENGKQKGRWKREELAVQLYGQIPSVNELHTETLF